MGRMIAKCAFFAVPLLFLFTGLAIAQTGTLEGKVTGEDGKPLVGALIKIERTDIKGNYSVKTNKKGEWLYTGLAFGTFKVSLVLDGKEVDSVRNVQTHLGDPTPVNFDMAARKKEQDALQEAAKTGKLSADQTRGMTPEQVANLKRSVQASHEQFGKQRSLNDAFNQGMTAFGAGQFQAAIDAFVKATEMDAKQDVIWGHLADAYYRLAKEKTGAEREAVIGKALESSLKAMELKPTDATYLNNYALELVEAKKIPEAQAVLEKAAQIDPPNAGRYFYNLGVVMSNTGQTDAAGQAFKRAIDIDPKYADAQYEYAVWLMQKAQIGADGKIQPAPGTREALQTYLALAPNGRNADGARALLASFDQAIQTEYANPAAKKASSKKK
jgi:tetratricopeptide (TPR) repeat protein